MIKVTTKNVEYNVNVLKRLTTYIGIADKPLRECAGVWRKGAAQQFASEGIYGTGSRWTALKPGTILGRMKQWGAGPILHRSGRLKRSWSSKSSGDYAEHVTHTSVQLGSIQTTKKKGHYMGAIHHFGAPKAGIPARPIMGYDGNIPASDRAQMEKILEKFIDNFIKIYS